MRVCKALKSLYTGDICTGFSAWSVLELTGTDSLDICHQWTIKPTWTNLTIDPQCLRLNIVLFDGVLGRKFRGLIFVHTALVVCRGKTELVDHSNLNYRWIHLVSSVGRGQILWYVWAYMVSGFYRKKMSHSVKKLRKYILEDSFYSINIYTSQLSLCSSVTHCAVHQRVLLHANFCWRETRQDQRETWAVSRQDM